MKPQIHLSDYQLIVSDIDGTLVGSSHIFHPYTRSVLTRLIQSGVHFTLATGKVLPATKAQADELSIKLPLVLSNGAVIQKRSGELLFNAALPLDVIQKVISISEDGNEDLVMYIIDQIFIKKMTENIRPIYSMVNNGLFEIGEWENIAEKFPSATKCLVVDLHNPDHLDEMGNIFRASLDGNADVVRASRQLVEVLPKGVNKATAVKRLADELGISMDQVMAFGDYDNDAPMLAAAGLGICVENGSAAAKAAADMIISSCEENGPAKFLDDLLAAAA